tara:strand:- start:71 stop:559 length:489 start_codon:yes stop_codon:yes gene_type:complete
MPMSFKYSSFGRTRQPKNPLFGQNLVGNTNYVIPNSVAAAGASVWDIANTRKDYGFSTENQRYMHVLIDTSTSAGADKRAQVGVLGYIEAFGVWAELLKYDLESNEPDNSNALQTLTTEVINDSSESYIFDIVGVDRVVFYAANANADDINDWQLRVAFSTF